MVMGSANHEDQRMSLVIVDDDSAVRHSLKYLLEAEGYAVTAFDMQAAAGAESEFQSAACLIVNHAPPGIDGLDFVARIRGKGLETPAILIASNLGERSRQRAVRTGIQVVDKPLLGDRLKTAIDLALVAN